MDVPQELLAIFACCKGGSVENTTIMTFVQLEHDTRAGPSSQSNAVRRGR